MNSFMLERRTEMKKVLIFLLAAHLAACNNERPPNVITIILDDATKNHIESGMPYFMQHIHPTATLYTSAVFDIPLCSPATANYLTGRIGRETGMTNCNPNEDLPETSEGNGISHNGANGLLTGGVGAFDFRKTLLTEMKQAGYAVGWLGKYLNGHTGNSISSVIDGKAVRINYLDVDKQVWKYADTYSYQPVPPGVDTWRAEFDHTISPGTYTFKIHTSDGQIVGDEEEWSESINFNESLHQGEHIEYFKREASKYLQKNKGKKKFLTLRLFNPHNAQLNGTLPFATVCSVRQALPHASTRYRGTVDPMSVALPLSLTTFLETVSDSTTSEANDGKSLFPCGVQDGLSHRQMYEMYYRYATAATIEALRDYDDLVREVVEELKSQGEYENTLLVLFNDNGMMNGEHGLYHKNKPWRESVELYLAIKYPHQHSQQIIEHHVSNTYIAPTILDTANINPSIPLHAGSLKEIAKRVKNQKILSEGYTRLCDKWEFEQASDGDKKYFIQYFPNKEPKEFFFDMKADSNELFNLIEKPEHHLQIEEFREFLRNFSGGPMNIEKNIRDYRNNCN
jgi:arylsulfatase A-like enzyme